MADIKDILGVSRDATPGPKAEKPKPEKRIKPKGMSRCARTTLEFLHRRGAVAYRCGEAAWLEKR